MGLITSKDIIVTTKFYGVDPTNDQNQTFGREQLPKC